MRRVTRGCIVVLVVLAPGGAIAGSCGPGAPRDPAGRGERHPRAPVVRVRAAWSKSVRGWPSQLTADRHGLVAISGGRFVTAFALDDGSRLWEAEVPGSLHPFTEPAVDARTVLVSAGDRFVALERVDGAVRWEAPASATGGAAGVALVPTGQAGTVAVTAVADGRLVGRDGATGAPRWGVAFAGSLDAHLAVDDATGLVVALWQTSGATTVRVFDGGSGVLRWEQAVEPMAASPAIGNGLVTVAAGDGDYRGNVHAFALRDGRVEWTTAVSGSFEPDQVPGVAPGPRGAEVGVQDHLGTVRLLDLGTGAVRWRRDTGVPSLGGRVLITREVVVVRNEGHQLVILDRSRGRVRDRRTDPAGLPEGIGAAGDRVLVGWRWTEPGRIDALEIEIPRSGPRARPASRP